MACVQVSRECPQVDGETAGTEVDLECTQVDGECQLVSVEGENYNRECFPPSGLDVHRGRVDVTTHQ